MKYTKQMLAAVLFFVPLMAAAQFQLGGTNGMVARVPFEFVVGNTIIPAGDCLIQSANTATDTILIRNRDAKVSLFSAASPVETLQDQATDALVFHKYGDRYFLAAVKVATSRTVYELPPSKGEIEMQAQNVLASEEIVHAGLK